MTIRYAQVSDKDAIISLLAQLGYPRMDESLVVNKIQQHQKDGYAILVSVVDDVVVGFISLHWFELMHWKGPLGRITSFCIDEHHRSKGTGQLLLKAAEELLLSKGCIKLEVTSNLRRTRTHEFYLKAGYGEDSRRFVKYRPD